MRYKKQFEENATEEMIADSKEAGGELLVRFEPLFKKYLVLIQTGHIDFGDREMKRFVLSFIGDPALKAALKRKRATSRFCHPINQRFAFVVETYGKRDSVDIMIDLQMLFFVLAKRYKQMGKNFCAYLYNAYCYEVSRHIKKYTNNPANIPYRNIEYEDYMQSYSEYSIENCFEDQIYENSLGIPDTSWVRGESCSDIFLCLTPEERKIIIKYYLEDYNDRQIAEVFGMHINTVNQKRRKATMKLAIEQGIDIKKIKHSRKSGKKALLYEAKPVANATDRA